MWSSTLVLCTLSEHSSPFVLCWAVNIYRSRIRENQYIDTNTTIERHKKQHIRRERVLWLLLDWSSLRWRDYCGPIVFQQLFHSTTVTSMRCCYCGCCCYDATNACCWASHFWRKFWIKRFCFFARLAWIDDRVKLSPFAIAIAFIFRVHFSRFFIFES